MWAIGTPIRNPYWASEPLHYYWTYFVVPATVIGNAPARLGLEIQQVLLINALLTGVLLIAMVFLLAWVVVPRAGPVAIAVSLALLASSAEGSYVVVDLLRRGRSLTLVREYNIDAIAAWAFNGLRIDGLQRSLWWVPQHAMACSLGLVALVVSAASGVRASLGTLALAGCALGLSVTMSPFLGASFSLVFGVATLFHALRAPRRLPADLARCSIAAVPVVAAIGWSVSTGVLEGTSGAMRMGLGGLAAHSPVVALLLSLGPALFLAAPGIWPAVRAQRPALTSLAGLLVGLAIYYLLWIPLDEAYIGFRAGQIILMTVPGLAAFAVAGLSDIAGRWAASLVIGLVFVVGLPTAAIDWYNAQDITYREMGPGFRWTQTITPEEADAFRWIRRATEPDATVQMEPIVRDRDTWTMIPTFAER
ncbi:MAG: hypothetical protein NTY02_20095, partial [Acidobacteria bacterium]|nr:hypothetical protein [Acidobacteriota bacterium]